jgi:hypothetical protein
MSALSWFQNFNLFYTKDGQSQKNFFFFKKHYSAVFILFVANVVYYIWSEHK